MVCIYIVLYGTGKEGKSCSWDWLWFPHIGILMRFSIWSYNWYLKSIYFVSFDNLKVSNRDYNSSVSKTVAPKYIKYRVEQSWTTTASPVKYTKIYYMALKNIYNLLNLKKYTIKFLIKCTKKPYLYYKRHQINSIFHS